MLASKRFLAVLAVVPALTATSALAVPPATVDAIVTPAWRDRQGRTEPLAVGMAVAHGDRIRTGDGARVYLKLAEGSTVKLGADAGLTLFSRSLRPQRDFKGALDVLAGAFRFTTDTLGRVKSRDVSVRVGSATAGIRGTDVWGRTSAEEDLVCLIDGKIEVRHAALAASLEMTAARSFFVVPKGGAPKPVGIVSEEELRQWSRETEIEAGAGAQRRDGKWQLTLGRHGSEAAALEQYDLVRSAGYAPRIAPGAAAAGGWEYAVVLQGFADEAEAMRGAARLHAATGIAATATR